MNLRFANFVLGLALAAPTIQAGRSPAYLIQSFNQIFYHEVKALQGLSCSQAFGSIDQFEGLSQALTLADQAESMGRFSFGSLLREYGENGYFATPDDANRFYHELDQSLSDPAQGLGAGELAEDDRIKLAKSVLDDSPVELRELDRWLSSHSGDEIAEAVGSCSEDSAWTALLPE